MAEAIESAVPLRRCSATPGRTPRSGPCAPDQLGVASCPCAGTISRAEYRAVVERAVIGLRHRPDLLLAPLEARMRTLAGEERFEEAADVRERAAALAQALRRQRQLESLVQSGRVVIEIGDRAAAELHGGRLQRAWLVDQLALGDGPDPVPGPEARPHSIVSVGVCGHLSRRERRLEATPGIEPGFTDLQSAASPLRHVAPLILTPCRRTDFGGRGAL